MHPLCVFVILFCVADAATPIALDTWLSMLAPASGFDAFCFNTTLPNEQIRIDLLGPSASGSRVQVEMFPAVNLVAGGLSPTILFSRGATATDVQVGSPCPSVVAQGQQEVRISTEGGTAQSYSIRIRTQDASLNGERVVQEPS